jgi:uncharacterized protein YndB with AHSA1/START domain
MGVGARLDARPGGAFRIDVDGEHFAAGEYVEVHPPHRLVLTWGWEGQDSIPPGSTSVEIELVADGAGTLLRLRHTGLPDREQRTAHLGGWNQYLERLSALFT